MRAIDFAAAYLTNAYGELPGRDGDVAGTSIFIEDDQLTIPPDQLRIKPRADHLNLADEMFRDRF